MSEAQIRARMFVQLYEEWRLTSEDDCPADIHFITEFMPSEEIYDPWGQPYYMLCGDAAPTGVELGVVSAGPDQEFFTGDDIRSWHVRKKKK